MRLLRLRQSDKNTYLLILISRHRYELGLFEDVRPEGGVGQLQDVVGPYQVEPRLVLVHRVQDRLRISLMLKFSFPLLYRGTTICVNISI